MSIEANIEKIQKEIEQACERCGREPSEVTLVAVSKFHPWQAVCRAAFSIAIGIAIEASKL